MTYRNAVCYAANVVRLFVLHFAQNFISDLFKMSFYIVMEVTKQINGLYVAWNYLKKLPIEIAISSGSSFEEPALMLKENCSRNGVT